MAAGHQGVGGADREPGHVEVDVATPARVGEQLERLLVVLCRLVGAAHRAGLPAGLDAGVQRGVEVQGQARVAGQLGGGPADRAVAQRRGVRRVQAHPFARQQVVVHRLPEQGVPERVAPLPGDEEVHLHRLAQPVVQGARVEPGGRGEQLVGHPAPGHAGGAHDLARGVVDPVEAHQQHVGEVVGDPATRGRRRADQLLDEERVALRPVDDVLHLGGRESAPGPAAELGDQRAHVPGRQRRQVDPVDPAQAGPLGHLGAQGMAPVQVVGAVRRDDGDRPGRAGG